MDKYIPFIIAVIVVLSITFLCLILYDIPGIPDITDIPNPPINETFDSVTKLLEDRPDVPTIKLVEKPQKKSIIQKIIGGKSIKIPFKIVESVGKDYTIAVPNYKDMNFSNKGLVIAAAGNRYRYLTGLYANLYTIRKYHKSNIPIEIFYVGRSEEFSLPIKNLINSLGNVTIHNLLDRIDTNLPEDELRGYQTKPLAVICSSFEEVILVDADALSFLDPQYLFLADGYESSGMLLFKDYVDCMTFISRSFIESIGIGVDTYCEYTGDFEIDSSCVVINKKKCWDSLYAICTVNVKSENYHKAKNVLGDKDLWSAMSLIVGDVSPYVSAPNPNVMISDSGKVIVGHLQSTLFEGKELFTHYNNQKIDLGSANVEGFKYAELKNPRSGEECNYGVELPEKVIESFKYAKTAMAELNIHIPIWLKEKVQFVNGISKGLID